MDIKDELYIKKIDKESYSSISAYLNKLFSMAGIINEPAIIILDGEKFIIQEYIGEQNGYVIVDGETLDAYTLFFDDLSNEKILIDKTHEYEIKRVGSEPIISRTNLKTLERESLFHKIYPDESALVYVNYHIFDNLGFDMKYRTTNNKNSLSYLITWLQYRNPDMVDFMRVKGFKIKTISTYLKTNDEKYTRSKVRIPGLGFLGISKNKIDKNTLESIINNYGFNMVIPNELTSILADNNDNVKRLKLLSNSYKHYKKLS